MRLLTLFVLIASFLVALAAASGGRAVIVSYPSDTPDSVLDQAKEAITNAGGTITHEYRLIKAFAAQASERALNLVQTYGTKYNALIEDDSEVSVAGNGS